MNLKPGSVTNIVCLTGLLLVLGTLVGTTGCAKKEAQAEAEAASSWNKPTDAKTVAEMNAKRQAAEQQRTAGGGTAAAASPIAK